MTGPHHRVRVGMELCTEIQIISGARYELCRGILPETDPTHLLTGHMQRYRRTVPQQRCRWQETPRWEDRDELLRL